MAPKSVETTKLMDSDDDIGDIFADNKPVDPEVYKRRWWILTVFSLTSIASGICWATWPPIAGSLFLAYKLEISFVAMAGLSYCVPGVLLGLQAIYIMVAYGKYIEVFEIFTGGDIVL